VTPDGKRPATVLSLTPWRTTPTALRVANAARYSRGSLLSNSEISFAQNACLRSLRHPETMPDLVSARQGVRFACTSREHFTPTLGPRGDGQSAGQRRLLGSAAEIGGRPTDETKEECFG
jgi:hypothetical protein